MIVKSICFRLIMKKFHPPFKLINSQMSGLHQRSESCSESEFTSGPAMLEGIGNHWFCLYFSFGFLAIRLIVECIHSSNGNIVGALGPPAIRLFVECIHSTNNIIAGVPNELGLPILFLYCFRAS